MSGHLERSWETFAAVVLKNNTDVWKRRFMRAAFYMGATAVFDAIGDHNDPATIPRNLDLMMAEINRYSEEEPS